MRRRSNSFTHLAIDGEFYFRRIGKRGESDFPPAGNGSNVAIVSEAGRFISE